MADLIIEQLKHIRHVVLDTDSFRAEFENTGFHITFGEPDAVIAGFDIKLAQNAGINGALIAADEYCLPADEQVLCVVEHLGKLGKMLTSALNS
ncbi:MAG: hypothetical protein L3J71_16000 [Victivallaceae bacterium]|nr:hypothetical protein [Victivallaceae bacterium]